MGGIIFLSIIGGLLGLIGGVIFFTIIYDSFINWSFKGEDFLGVIFGGLLLLLAFLCIGGSIVEYQKEQEIEYQKYHKIEQEC